MKKYLPFLIIATIISLSFTGTSICSENDFFVAGTVSKMGHYDTDGKQTGTSTSTVTKVYTSGDSTIAEIETDYVDAKKKESHKGNMRYICIGDAIVLDMSGIMSAAASQQGKDMKMVMEGNFVSYKKSYAVGEALPDIHLTMKTFSDGNLVSTMNVHMHDRKVEAKENRTTAAGTFECYKISSISETQMQIGTMNMPGMKPSKSVDYYSPKAGMIRMEQFRSEKMSSYSELLELKKP